VVVCKKACRETTNMNAAATVEEARSLAHRLIEYERGKCAGDVDVAIHRASSLYGIEESALRSLRYRWRSLKFVKAHIFLRLKQIDEWFDERAKQERQALNRTAEILEQRGSRAAGIARFAAEMAGTEE
jgi:hypothetical protein